MTTENHSVKVPPVLYRQGTSELREDGSIRLSISSDRPYLRYDWWNEEEYYEILDHKNGGVDLTRITAGTALLFNHDRDIQLGKITQPELKEGRCFVAAKVSKADDVASFRTRIEEGILKDSSVGYELIDDGEQVEDIDGINAYRFKWRPFEASLVTIPADISVGVGRERDLEKPKGEPREIRIREKTRTDENFPLDSQGKESQKRESPIPSKEKSMTPEEQAAQAEKDRKQRERDEAEAARERSEKIQEGIKAAREREKEIRAIAERADVPEEKKGEFDRTLEGAIEKAITEPTAVKDFQDYVFKTFWGKAKPLDTPSSQGSGDIRVVGERNQSLGARFVNSKEFQEQGARLGKRRSISADMPTSMIGLRGKAAAMAQRAGFTSGDLAAINIAPQQSLIALGVQRMTIMDLIAPGTTDKAAIPYPRENTFGTVEGVAVAAGAMPRARSVGERGVKPTWEPDITTETANVRKIAVVTKVPDEFMADFPGMQSYIDERLPYMVDAETEQQVLYGNGLGNELKGILTTANIQTRPYATSWADTLKKAITDVEVGSFFMADGIAMHPYDFEVASLEKDVNGQYLMGGPVYLPYGVGQYVQIYNIWGKPVVSTTAVAVGKPVVGAWRLGAQYFIREGMRLETTNANEDDFKRNLIAIRAEHRLALAVYRPVAFLEVTGGPART